MNRPAQSRQASEVARANSEINSSSGYKTARRINYIDSGGTMDNRKNPCKSYNARPSRGDAYVRIRPRRGRSGGLLQRSLHLQTEPDPHDIPSDSYLDVLLTRVFVSFCANWACCFDRPVTPRIPSPIRDFYRTRFGALLRARLRPKAVLCSHRDFTSVPGSWGINPSGVFEGVWG